MLTDRHAAQLAPRTINEAISVDATWNRVRAWYTAHGYIVAASSMGEIMREWRDPWALLAKLEAHDG